MRGVSAETLRRRLPLGCIDLIVLLAIIVIGAVRALESVAADRQLDLGESADLEEPVRSR